jgi:hypothetical protein
MRRCEFRVLHQELQQTVRAEHQQLRCERDDLPHTRDAHYSLVVRHPLTVSHADDCDTSLRINSIAGVDQIFPPLGRKP